MNGDSDIQTTFIFQCNLHTNLKNANHSSLIRNNVVPCICLRVMTYAWSDVRRNTGIRKTNSATRYVGPRVAGCALCYRVVTSHWICNGAACYRKNLWRSCYKVISVGTPAIRHIHVKNTCPIISQVPGNLQCKILVAAVGTTHTLLFQPRHHQEKVPPKDVVLEGCLVWQAIFTVRGQHFFVDILCCHIFCPQKPHNVTLFCHGTRIQGRRHLVTAAPSLQSRA